MKNALVILSVLFSTGAFAAQSKLSHDGIPLSVYRAADKLMSEDVRYVIEKTAGDNPCDAGYSIKIMVKTYSYNMITNQMSTSEVVANTVTADENGQVGKVCAE